MKIWLQIALICSVHLTNCTLFGQSDPASIRIDSTLVQVPVAVIDRDGSYVSDLKAEEFRIFENGIEQKVEFFNPVISSASVLLLLDRSGSMNPHFEELTRAANLLTAELNPEDSVSAASFADDVDVIFGWTRKSELKSGFKIRRHSSDAWTHIYDAVDLGLDRTDKRPGKTAIVLFSDGEGSGRFATAKKNGKKASESTTAIYTVRFMPVRVSAGRTFAEKYAESDRASREYMWSLANLTGGRAFEIASISDLAAVFREIGAEISRQYMIGYYPSKDGTAGETRRIKIEVSRPNVAVRSRTEVVFKGN